MLVICWHWPLRIHSPGSFLCLKMMRWNISLPIFNYSEVMKCAAKTWKRLKSSDSYASLFSCMMAGRTQWRPRHKAFTNGLGLDAVSLAWPTVVHLAVSFNSALQWGLAKSTLCFVTVIDLILCFRWDALIELGSHYANQTFYVFFILRIISGPRVKFVQWKAFKPPGSVYYWPF